MTALHISLSKFEKPGAGGSAPAGRKNSGASGAPAASRGAVMEFHIRREVREEYGLEHRLFSLTGNVVLIDLRKVRELAAKFNAKVDPRHPERFIRAGQLYAMGLIDEILHYLVALYREQVQPDLFTAALDRLNGRFSHGKTEGLLHAFGAQFPPQAVYAGETTVDTWLKGSEGGESHRDLSLEEILLLALANMNPAFKPFGFLFSDRDLANATVYPEAIEELRTYFALLPPFGPEGMNLWDLLRAPALASPDSLTGQLAYLRDHWGVLLGKYMARLLTTLDVIKEEEKPFWGGSPGPTEVISYQGLDEYEKFSPDQEWMPRTVLMAKSTLVWLYQLSKKYRREISRLDQIPDEELDELARRGFTGLWLIGLWERSNASRTVKQWMGNPEAAASAYSLYDYDIAAELGGWGALGSLRERCIRRGIRLGSDMVPNHTGLDSRWIMEHPERFLQLPHPPFPTYTYNSGNLSNREGIGIYLEDHYYTRNDAAVVFKRVDFRTGDTRYIYHGNDGTSMPWNDTAQIDFLNPEAREAVIRTIIGVCQQFSIVRFDAAMTLAKRHIQRLWYPEPGRGGDIASRAEYAISGEEFNRRIPQEFWREVVDRCAAEAPHTLLLAEAFWMMEGYFVRTLGMHRVYNSAFMNMLKNEENAKYRATIKNTLEFDPEILKRFVNFMNNPDEETAAAQFGRGDKYFGICTLLVTMPGLPMFGHGQIEGFEEKYGMEYRRAYRDEQPDPYLVERHEREIFPLMKRRHVFSGSAGFRLYDFYTSGGHINENVFAYSNRDWDDRALVLYNNSYHESSGWIKQSSPAIPQENGGFRQDTLTEALSIHGESRYFTCFREQRSGLWFIRSSKSLGENGLFAVLKGYESQVFMDIHEREDGIAGGLPADSPWACRWSRLNHDLAGRGVPDLDAAAEDIFLADLYRPFTALFDPPRVEALREALKAAAPGKAEPPVPGEALPPPLPRALAESFRQPVLDFAEAAAGYLDGAGGRYEPFPRLTGESSAGETGPAGSAGEEAWTWFSSFLARFLEASGFKAPAETGPYEPLYALAYGALALLRPVLGPRASGTEIKALLLHWRLDRKIREAYRALGFDRDETCRVAEIMKAALVRTGAAKPARDQAKTPSPKSSRGKGGKAAKAPVPAPAAGSAKTRMAAFLAANYEAEDFRRLLKVNRFDDVTWFNKEAFEEALYYASLFLLAEDNAVFATASGSSPAAPQDGAQRAAFIAELVRRAREAEKESGYRLDELAAILSGP
jgi:hypothetical protein